MDPSRVLDVLVVCLPVFAVMGLGKVLAVKGQLGRDRRTFINWLVYYFALPSLIFHAVAQQRFSSFMEPGVTLVPVAALIAVGVASDSAQGQVTTSTETSIGSQLSGACCHQ